MAMITPSLLYKEGRKAGMTSGLLFEESPTSTLPKEYGSDHLSPNLLEEGCLGPEWVSVAMVTPIPFG